MNRRQPATGVIAAIDPMELAATLILATTLAIIFFATSLVYDDRMRKRPSYTPLTAKTLREGAQVRPELAIGIDDGKMAVHLE